MISTLYQEVLTRLRENDCDFGGPKCSVLENTRAEAADTIEALTAQVARLTAEVPNASDIRFRFNEAIAGGANMDGDAGPFICSEGHASHLEMAIARIAQLEAELAGAREAALPYVAAWANRYAFDQGYDSNELHPLHYDVMRSLGARMDDFKRRPIAQERTND